MSISLAFGTFFATLAGSLFIFRRLFLPSQSRFLLVSLPYSHFVEIARWSLKLNPNGKDAYDEIKFPIGPHCLFVPIFRLAFGGTADSSSLPGYSSSIPFSPWQLQPRFFRKLMGLPFTVDSNGKSYSDSWSHLEIANLTIEDDFKLLLDDILGPAIRQVGYNDIFKSNMQFYRDIQPGVSLQRGMWFLMLIHDFFEKLFKVTSIMRSLMALNDEQVAISSERIIDVFQKCDEILASHRYLGSGSGSDTFGGADLAFSALAAWAFCLLTSVRLKFPLTSWTRNILAPNSLPSVQGFDRIKLFSTCCTAIKATDHEPKPNLTHLVERRLWRHRAVSAWIRNRGVLYNKTGNPSQCSIEVGVSIASSE